MATAEAAVTVERAGAARRLPEVDVLRGFALLGILLVNVQTAAGPYGDGGDPSAPPVDRVARWLVTALVSGKFYLLFAFLFGYSFTLQERAARRAGAAFAARHLRRLIGLFLLGLAHAVLLFAGDILTAYAALGLLLYAARGATPRRAVRLAAGLVAALALLLLGLGLVALATTAPPQSQGATASVAEVTAAYRGEAASVVRANLAALPGRFAGFVLSSPHLLAAMLLGLAAGRRGLLAGRHRDRDRARARLARIVRLGLPVGLAGGAFMALCRVGPLDARWWGVGMAVGVLSAPALTAAYACGLLLVVDTRRGRWLGGLLAPAGRMTLTHYLGQSLVMALVFTGYGLGWYGRLGTAALLLGALVLYAAQLALSGWLLRRVRHGPVERLLSRWTHGRRPRAGR